jgi:hypothetical protein
VGAPWGYGISITMMKFKGIDHDALKGIAIAMLYFAEAVRTLQQRAESDCPVTRASLGSRTRGMRRHATAHVRR